MVAHHWGPVIVAGVPVSGACGNHWDYCGLLEAVRAQRARDGAGERAESDGTVVRLSSGFDFNVRI